jgi:hypothetical protein
MFVLLFGFVCGGVIAVPGGDYREYLIGGILVQTIAWRNCDTPLKSASFRYTPARGPSLSSRSGLLLQASLGCVGTSPLGSSSVSDWARLTSGS